MNYLAALLIGLTSLGSEILYLRSFDFILGSGGLFTALTLGFFILGSALGSYWSVGFSKPQRIEILLGIYSIIFGLCISYLPSLLSNLLDSELLRLVIAGVLLAVPTVGLGFTFPALARWSMNTKKVYMLQALGGGLGLVILEIFILYFGISASFILIGLLHFVIALILKNKNSPKELWDNFSIQIPSLSFGTLTGMLQGLFLILGYLIFQPFSYTNSIIIFNMLLGIYLGSLWISKNENQNLGQISIYLITTLIFFSFLIFKISSSSFHLWEIKFQLLFSLLLLLPSAFFIGSVFPVLIKKQFLKEKVSSTLISLSIGNLIGLFLSHQLNNFIPFYGILILIILGLVYFVEKNILNYIFIALALIASFGISEERLILMAGTGQGESVLFYQKKNSELSGVYIKNQQRVLYQSGFSPIILDEKKESIITYVGAASTAARENCLVIGVGSGRSAGACGLLFNHTDYVDISKNTVFLIDKLSKDNFNLINNPKASFLEMDGLLIPYKVNKLYDLIILTVDPGYQSSAGKLYTVEYLHSLKKLLTPSGSLIFWLDGTMSKKAQEVIINSSKEVFSHQGYYIIDKEDNVPSYYLVINKTDALVFNPFHVENFNFNNLTQDLWWNFNHKELHRNFTPHLSILTSGFDKKAYFPKGDSHGK